VKGKVKGKGCSQMIDSWTKSRFY